jgi:hypothetical protein
MTEKFVSTSLNINPELWKRFKIKCIELDVRVQDALDFALRTHLGMPIPLTSGEES